MTASTVIVPKAAGYSAYDPTSVAITGGTITGTNVPYVWVKYQIPIILASSGSMGNNGALTALTALGTTYSSAYIVLPAGAIAAGVPAATDIYFVQMSSATAGTVFNNRLADNLDANGGPTIPASPTAFVTTGPGAFAGVTGATTLLTLALPASTIGTTGKLYIDSTYAATNNANAKTATITFGATNLFNQSIASMAGYFTHSDVSSFMNSTSKQISKNWGVTTGAAVSGTFTIYPTETTTGAINVAFKGTHSGAATDNIVLEELAIIVVK